jgi:hypothetical protein
LNRHCGIVLLSPDELADETLNRVPRRLEEEGEITDNPPARYRANVDKGELEEARRELKADLDKERASSSEIEREIDGLRDKVARLEQQYPLEQSARSPSEQLTIVPFVLSPQLRGAGNLPELKVPSDSDFVAIKLAPTKARELRVSSAGGKTAQIGRSRILPWNQEIG